jgi:sugar lactone lactonase YvrE
MQWPFMAAAGTDGTIYIIEAIGGHVQRLSPDGQWLRPISSWGMELGQLYRPKGIAIDNAGDIFVSDSTTGAVQVFGPQGAVLGVLCDADGEILRLQHPMGMCFDGGGRLLVVESADARVTVIEVTSRSANRDKKSEEAAP